MQKVIKIPFIKSVMKQILNIISKNKIAKKRKDYNFSILININFINNILPHNFRN